MFSVSGKIISVSIKNPNKQTSKTATYIYKCLILALYKKLWLFVTRRYNNAQVVWFFSFFSMKSLPDMNHDLSTKHFK